ncbi:glucose 1-dehydrogenase [Ketobacter sp. MCCC 1A13808]|nr:glucose 1-dehydrogenase [Ketobacter sp. MCCC 1A13808]RLP53240.1 MAG: glucose 1-dehydrogenase [Ketobacter sp.]
MDALLDFTGKVALVTGGSRGLGYQMVIGLAERGADIIIASRKLEQCERVAEEVRQLGRKALAVSTHVGQWAQIDALIESAYQTFGRVDILINNAGMSPACPSHEVSEKLFDSVMNLNFKGPFYLSSQVARRMVAAGGGSIINISSSGALMALPGVVPYGCAKAALNAMTVSMAAEYGPKVRINTVSAGPFMTEAHADWTEEVIAKIKNAAQRPGQPQEIISAVLMLASDASSFTTGSTLRVDGGQRG